MSCVASDRFRRPSLNVFFSDLLHQVIFFRPEMYIKKTYFKWCYLLNDFSAFIFHSKSNVHLLSSTFWHMLIICHIYIYVDDVCHISCSKQMSMQRSNCYASCTTAYWNRKRTTQVNTATFVKFQAGAGLIVQTTKVNMPTAPQEVGKDRSGHHVNHKGKYAHSTSRSR